jgi:hypothetical protein
VSDNLVIIPSMGQAVTGHPALAPTVDARDTKSYRS